MKKFSFLMSTVCLVCSSLMTSCFSSGGEIPESHIKLNGYTAQKLNLNGITTIQAICEVGGLKGYAVIPQETSIKLYSKNIDGLLIFLREIDDPDLTKLKTLDQIADKDVSFPTSAKVIQAFCYPHNVTFEQSVDLTILTPDCDGADFLFHFMGDENDCQPVKTSVDGLTTTIPHFSYWVFKMNFTIKCLETTYYTSPSFKTECKLVSSVNPQTAKYEADYGYTSKTETPFVTVFLKQWTGIDGLSKKQFTYEYMCTDKPGVEEYRYVQPIYHLCMTSGTHDYYFDVYGTPVGEHVSFTSKDHNGGSGTNP